MYKEKATDLIQATKTLNSRFCLKRECSEPL